MTQVTTHWHEAVGLPGAPEWMQELRRSAFARFEEAGWPERNDERYTYSDLRDLHQGDAMAPAAAVDLAALEPFLTGDEVARIVFVDGHHAPELSDLPPVDGLTVLPMAQALDYPQTRHHFESLAAGSDPMELLHCATWQDGAFVLSEAEVPGTVHVLFVDTGAGGVRSLHNAFVADAGSGVTVVESHIHLADNTATTLDFSVLVAGENARLDHVKVQKADRRARHVGSQKTLVLRDGRCRSHLLDVGADRSRQGTTATLLGENAEVDLQGVFFGQRDQRKDVWTRVEHAVPHGRSNETFKGILDDASRGAFTGLVVVQPGAHGTSSDQQNRNLLLSAKAHADATPQLEIHNDDVQCAHGSTIGQLDDEALFFLRSRGIGADEARLMLTRAFASDVIQSIPSAPIRKLMDRYLHVWFIKHQEHL